MKLVTLGLTLLLVVAEARADEQFAAIEVWLVSDQPVAAWQFELTAPGGAMSVVGVENGAHRAFDDAPYYDLAAVERGTDRLIVADFSLVPAAELPRGRTRITTIHVLIDQTARPSARLVTVNGPDGQQLAATLELVRVDPENGDQQ